MEIRRLTDEDAERAGNVMARAFFNDPLRPFYEKHGFEIVREGSAPGSGVPYLTFLRRPGAGTL
jgi:hypothetical protein